MKTRLKYLIIILIAASVGTVEVANAFYDPGLQRWINRDPMADVGSLPVIKTTLAPGSESDKGRKMSAGELRGLWLDINRHLYGAMGNNAVNRIDAFGLCPLANPMNAEAYAPGSTFLSGRPDDISLWDYLQFVGASIAGYVAATATLGLAAEAILPVAVESGTGVLAGGGTTAGTIGTTGSLASTLGTGLTTTTVVGPYGMTSLLGGGATVAFPQFAPPAVFLWGSGATGTGTLLGAAAIASPLLCNNEK